MPDGYIQLDKSSFESGGAYQDLNRMMQFLYDQMPGDGESVRIYKGYGSPEGVVVAGVGSLYLRLDGTTDTTIYKKESGTLATGWVAIVTPTFPLSLANGGTGVALSDPGADRVLFWDESANEIKFLTVGSNLTISDTTISASGGINFLSSTSPSAVTETGDMTITSGKTYLMVFSLKANSNTAVIAIRINNSSSTIYQDNRIGHDGSATIQDDAVSATEITIADLVADGYANGQIYIRTIGDNTVVMINGNAVFNDSGTGGGLSIINFAGSADDGSAISSIEIVRESGTGTLTGSVNLYELSNS